MTELAKTHITITDESAYALGVNTLIPLYVIATEQDKVIDETTGEIAPATTKGMANKINIVTSKSDVISKYGLPKFMEVNGTVLQGDERNEYGLYGLYDAMGSTSLAYAVRADIDLKQLSAKEEEPTSAAKNGTLWLDMFNTNLGVFKCIDENLTPANAWEKIEVELYDHAPLADEGMIGDFAVYFENGVQTLKEKTGSKTWTVVGQGGEKVFHQPSIKYPKVSDGLTAGSIWVKTTPVNDGARYILKKYSSTSERWVEQSMPMCVSLVDAEAAYGTSLKNGSITVQCDKTTAGATFMTFVRQEKQITVLGEGEAETLAEGTFNMKFVANGSLKSISVPTTLETRMDDLVTAINAGLKKYKVTSVIAENTGNHLQIIADGITTLNIEVLGNLKATLNIKEGDIQGDVASWNKITNIKVGMFEPREVAEDGTLWFNDDIKVDIMVNDGTSWQGYKKKYSDADIYVTAKEPEQPAANSLWIDPSQEDFPMIKRFIGNAWVLADNSDQTTPNGVVFADARFYADLNEEPTYTVDVDGKVTSNLLKSVAVDPDCPNPQTYPEDILLFNTRFSTNNVKEYKANPFEGLYEADGSYTVGGYEGTMEGAKTARWVSASGNAFDGSGLFGKKAQRKMVVNALAAAISGSEELRAQDYDFFFATCPGYPEVDDEFISLNTDKKEMFEIVTDTPKDLRPDGRAIQEWGTNANNASTHGSEGRVLKNEYVTRQYPSMGLVTTPDGMEVAVPTSIAKMKNLLVLPRGQIAAGTQYGQVSNLGSVGYITDEEEYASVIVNDGLGEVCTAQSINPIMPRRNTGLLFWGEATENPVTSSLSDEHAILTLLRLKRELEVVCLPFFFRINNETLRTEFYKALEGVLNQYIGTGEIYDFALEVEGENTPDRINRKELWGAIAIEVAKGVEQVYLPIRVVATGALD